MPSDTPRGNARSSTGRSKQFFEYIICILFVQIGSVRIFHRGPVHLPVFCDLTIRVQKHLYPINSGKHKEQSPEIRLPNLHCDKQQHCDADTESRHHGARPQNQNTRPFPLKKFDSKSSWSLLHHSVISPFFGISGSLRNNIRLSPNNTSFPFSITPT